MTSYRWGEGLYRWTVEMQDEWEIRADFGLKGKGEDEDEGKGKGKDDGKGKDEGPWAFQHESAAQAYAEGLMGKGKDEGKRKDEGKDEGQDD